MSCFLNHLVRRVLGAAAFAAFRHFLYKSSIRMTPTPLFPMVLRLPAPKAAVFCCSWQPKELLAAEVAAFGRWFWLLFSAAAAAFRAAAQGLLLASDAASGRARLLNTDAASTCISR